MKRHSLIIGLVAITLWPTRFVLGSSGEGTTSVQLLRLDTGARAVGMGGAYSAVADDPTAIVWNSAALTRVKNPAITFMHAEHVDSSFYDFVGYARGIGKMGALGIGFQYLSYGDVDETNVSGQTVGTFTPNEMVASIGYAHDLKIFSLGVVGKFIRSALVDSASTAALDFGLLGHPYWNGKIRHSLTLSNLGGTIKYESKSEDLPVMARIGNAFQATKNWQWSLDLGFPKEGDAFFALGTEYNLDLSQGWRGAGRLGYNQGVAKDLDGMAGLGFGFGVGYQKFGLDYAMTPFGDLGTGHKISINYGF